ncbi:hypothetical protein POSPLADRAFT_1155277, partial [Postia placenta MAD-698-R-SB12]
LQDTVKCANVQANGGSCTYPACNCAEPPKSKLAHGDCVAYKEVGKQEVAYHINLASAGLKHPLPLVQLGGFSALTVHSCGQPREPLSPAFGGPNSCKISQQPLAKGLFADPSDDHDCTYIFSPHLLAPRMADELGYQQVLDNNPNYNQTVVSSPDMHPLSAQCQLRVVYALIASAAASLALRRLGAVARRVGARAAVGLDVGALHGFLRTRHQDAKEMKETESYDCSSSNGSAYVRLVERLRQLEWVDGISRRLRLRMDSQLSDNCIRANQPPEITHLLYGTSYPQPGGRIPHIKALRPPGFLQSTTTQSTATPCLIQSSALTFRLTAAHAPTQPAIARSRRRANRRVSGGVLLNVTPRPPTLGTYLSIDLALPIWMEYYARRNDTSGRRMVAQLAGLQTTQ